MGLGQLKINPKKDDEVEVHIRKEGNGRLHASVGRVRHVDPDHSNRVRLEGRKNYREVLRIINTSLDVYDFK